MRWNKGIRDQRNKGTKNRKEHMKGATMKERYKKMSIVILVFGVLVSLWTAFSYTQNNYTHSEDIYWTGVIFVFLLSMILPVTLAMIMRGMVKIIKNQEEITRQIRTLQANQTRMEVKTEVKSWECSKCHEQNPEGSISCKSCGSYK